MSLLVSLRFGSALVRPRSREELANVCTHGLGLALSIPGLVWLVLVASGTGSAPRIVSAAIYGTMLVLLYLASTLYHLVPPGRAKGIFQVVDHGCIYLLIAGTYTPFTLLLPSRGWGWALFGTIWGLAALGIVAKVFTTGRFVLLSTLIYVAMGWLCVVAVVPLVQSLSWSVLLLLLLGGLAYTLGTIFFLRVSLRFHHALWHIAVLKGSAFHYVAVYLVLMPTG